MGLIPFTRENVLRVPNTGGIYTFYDRNGNAIYVGRSSGNVGDMWGDEPHERFRYGLRHRLQSYYQKDDFSEHKTKRALRNEIAFFSYKTISTEKERRYVEGIMKKNMRHNWG